MATSEDVYCTLVLNDAYLPGAAVLAHSLRDCGTTKKLACLVTVDTLKASTLDELRSLYNYVIPVERVANPSPKNLYLMNRADLLYTFTKIQLWRQTQFRKIVYIDADVVALRAPEELFDIQDNFAAAPDVGWPDIFNTGVMLLTPSEAEFRAISNMAQAGDSFDGADQGLLNQYFEHKPWKRLSFKYNCTPSANYQYEPAYRYFKRDITLVHFIGSSKPWQQDRSAAQTPNAFQELLARWWAVYDRHIPQAPADYINGQASTSSISSSTNQTTASSAQLSSIGYPNDSTMPAPAPGAPSIATDPPLTDRQEQIGHVEPTRTAHAPPPPRTFAAPQTQWDATKAPPPLESKPEAANFPSQIYEFNADRDLFHAPTKYPEPPKDMWFKVPAEQPRQAERPAPIFPWEERAVPRPTRRFLDDEPEPASQAPIMDDDETDFGGYDEFEVSNDTTGISTPTITVTSETSWDAFGASNRNAWDEVSGIENYVRALTSWQKNRGKVQVVHSDNTPQQTAPHLTDEILESLADKVNERRESLILTDFPTAAERPSLPVTPAPRRRTTFWGDDDDGDSEQKLPSAHGVPHQADWDPAEQLEQLRRNSLIGPEHLKLAAARSIPSREAIASAAPIPDEVLNHPVVQAQDLTPTADIA